MLPEPPRAHDELHQAHVLVSQVAEPQHATLITAVYTNSYGDSQLWRHACAMPASVTDGDVFARVPQAWRFRAGDVDQCTIFWNEVVLSRIPRPVPHGAGLVLHHEQSRHPHDGDPFAPVLVDLAAPTPAGDDEFAAPPQEGDVAHFMSHPLHGRAELPDLFQSDLPEDSDLHSFMAMGPPRFIGYAEADDLTHNPAVAEDLDHLDPLPPDDPPEGPPAEDSESESQRSVAHSLWLSSVTFSLSRPACSGRTDWTNHDTLHRSIATNLAVSHHDLQAVYHVKVAPEDLSEHYTQAFVALLSASR